jgi:hypothetical protein
MIAERSLRRWRKDALVITDEESMELFKSSSSVVRRHTEMKERILRLTQELLDLHLIRKG